MTTVPVTIQERIPMPVDVAARPGAPGAGLSAGDLVRILKQRIFLILFVWIGITGATAGLTAYLVREYPLYKAVSAVFVESPFPRAPMELGERLVQVELMDRFVADQGVLLKDEQVLRDTLEHPDVRATAWFRSYLPDHQEALEDLKDDLKVNQIAGTSFLRVSFSTHDPQDAPKIVNMVIEKYLAKVGEMSQDRYRRELDEYKKTESLVTARLEENRDRKRQFIVSELAAPGVTEGLNVVGETWRALAGEVTRLEAEKLQYQAAYENLQGVDPAQIAINPETTMMIEQDPQVAALRNATLGLKQEQRLLDRQGFGENHRAVEQLEAQLKVVEDELERLWAQKEQEVRDSRLNAARTMYLNAMQAEFLLQERALEAKAKQEDLDHGLARFRELEEEQFLLADQLTRIRDYVSQLQLMVGDQDIVRVRSVGTAYPPDKRDFPRWEFTMPAGSVLGLMLGLGLALLIELVDTSIKTSRDILRHVHVPILGTVPHLDDEEVPIEKMELAAHTAPRSMVAEAFRTIRTNLLLSSPAERQRSVLVTSSRPEEGKTSVAANLAISIGQSGRRVLLVDANFHRPALHALFPNSQRAGLSNGLIGQARVDELVIPTDLPNLDVMRTGPIPPNPAELLASPYLRELITQATERYDQVIFDGPPVLLVSDVLVMADSMDGVVLVCMAKTSSRGVVQRAREQLERGDAHIFGAVLNAAQVTRGGYFREQIRTYYDYQTEAAALPAEAAPALPPEEEDQNPPTTPTA